MLMKKTSLITTLALSIFASSHVYASDLIDIQDHWATNSIHVATSKGYVDGYPDGSFKPDNNVSRAEFITMLSKATGNKGKDGEQWYTPYVAGLKAKKVLFEGEMDDLNAPMSRLELATLSLRMVDKKLQDPDTQITNESLRYNAVKAGLIHGMTDGALEPNQPTTRAQSTMIIERVLSALKGEQLPVDKMALQLAEVAIDGTNFLTMYDRKPATKLPIVHNLVGEIKVTINEMYIVDSGEKNSPFNFILEGALRGIAKSSLENSYIIIFKVTYDLGEGGTSYRIPDYFKIPGWDVVYVPRKTYININSTDKGTVDSYLMFAFDKARLPDNRLPFPGYQMGGTEFPTVQESW
jgi:hypothetical protein